MSFEHVDVGGLSHRLSEIFYDHPLGDVSVSVEENQETSSKTEDQLVDEQKYGDCYIFDYQEFKDEPDLDRPGSEKDVARLRHDFTALNFNVYSALNLTKQATLVALKKAAENVPEQSKCFVCCFLTHGDEGKLLMHDKYLKIEDILKCFSRSACRNLLGVPKIFIFQACRGRICEEGVYCDSTDGDGSEMDNPDYLDFLLVYSTYEGKYSFKTKNKEHAENNHGSFFIDELCCTLEQFSAELDFLQILTMVNYRIAHLYLSHTDKTETNRKKQMPGFDSRLTTKVKFNRQIKIFESEDTKYFAKRRIRMASSGSKRTENPLEYKKMYNIQKPRIKFLSFVSKKTKFGSDLNDCASELWSSVAESGYQREPLEILSKEKMIDSLKKVAVNGCANTDCLICLVACQAKGNDLCDNNGKRFSKKDIIEQFTGKACQDLRGKPKIFIFLTSTPPKKSKISILPCVSSDSTDGESCRMIPVHSDLLEVALTIETLEQLESVTEKFCEIFRSESSEDFISQLTRMNAELVKSHEFHNPSNKNLATFYFYSTLTKTLILNKPEYT